MSINDNAHSCSGNNHCDKNDQCRIVPYSVSARDSSVFKVPGIPLKKQEILNEEEYVSNMERIIERDYFPALKKLKATSEYLQAVEENDLVKIQELTTRLAMSTQRPGTGERSKMSSTGMRTPSKSGWGIETEATPVHSEYSFDGRTPCSTCGDSSELRYDRGGRDNAAVVDNVSLSEYLNKYTSEDNASFDHIVVKERIRNIEKNARFLGRDDEGRLAIEGGLSKEPLAIMDSQNRAKNDVFYYPSGSAPSQAEINSASARGAASISRSSTRLPSNRYETIATKTAPPGKPETSFTHMMFPNAAHAAFTPTLAGDKALPLPSPKVRGYRYVATPKFEPGVDASPIMTWGNIEGTPLRLVDVDNDIGPGPTRGPQFRMSDVPRRERLTHLLVDEIAEKKKKQNKQQPNTPRQRREGGGMTSRSSRIGNMSPAARLLISRSSSSTGKVDSALRASYSPSPVAAGKRRSLPTPIRMKARNTTVGSTNSTSLS